MTKCIFLGIGPSSVIELVVAIIHAEKVKIERGYAIWTGNEVQDEECSGWLGYSRKKSTFV
jgi:hypothetical protein